LKPITETCQPRPDVLAGLEDRDFAAQLEKVVTGDSAYRSYTEAERFFDLTYPTSGLRELIAETFGHITGHGGSSILRSQTSFGGGKTHSLIALYHLAKGYRPSNLDEFVEDDAILPTGPVRVAAVVADTLDPISGTTTSGRTTFTLWGEIAAQLGDDAWGALAEHDAARTAPGTGAIRKMLDGGPAIIVIDELAQHLVNTEESGNADVRRQGAQVAPFLKNLSEEVDGRDDVVVVITLASKNDAYADATAELERVLNDVGAVMARKGRDIQPATEAEIAEILKRRLFTSIDADAAAEAAVTYREFYAKAADEVGLTGKLAADTADALEASYPFHPELVRLLDKRIGTIPKFQRTRGALRLLSRLITAVWDGDDAPTVLNVADLPLANQAVRSELTDRIDRHKFAEVITADVAGTDPFAARVDQRDYQGRPVTRRAATTVLAHSLEETAEAGSPLAEVALGTLRPGDDPALIEDALGRLHGVAWHLSFDNVRWRFQTAPNANRIVSAEAERVLTRDVDDHRTGILDRMCKSTANIETRLLPDQLELVPDEPKFNLAIVDHTMVTVTDRNANDVPDALKKARKDGPSGAPRTNRNGVGYLVADADKVADMDFAVRKMIAALAIVGADARMQSYSDGVQAQLRDIADTSHLNAHIAVARCFKHFYYPAANAKHGDLTHVAFTAEVQGAIGERTKGGKPAPGRSWTEQVWQTLIEMEKVRPSDKPLATNWLKSKAWPKNNDRIRTVDMLNVFWKDHSADLLPDSSPVVRGIQNGILHGDWAMQDLRDATDGRGKVFSNRSGTGTPPPVAFHQDVWLVDYQVAVDEGLLATPTTVTDVKKLVERLGDDETITAPDLRAALEKAKQGHEPSKKEVRDTLADAIRAGTLVVERDGEQVTPGDLTGDKVGFDTLTIRKPADDQKPLPEHPKTRRFKGAAGPMASQLQGWVADSIVQGHTDGLTEVTVTVEVNDDAPEGAKTIITMLGSLPDVTDITFKCEITYGIDGVDGEMAVTVEEADRRQSQQKVKAVLTAAGEKAGPPIDGTATVTFRLDQPHAADAPKVAGLFKTFTTYFTGPVELRGRIA
jgi:hypothetical protein